MQKYFSFLLFPLIANAGNMGETVKNEIPLSVYFGSGYSWSNTLKINPDPAIWDPAQEGYSSSVGGTEFYTLGFGARVSPLITLTADVTQREQYEYRRHQTDLGGAAAAQGNKSREFDIENRSMMLNAKLHGSAINDSLTMQTGSFQVEAFVGGGVGVSYNTVKNFHSVLPTVTIPGTTNVTSIGNDVKTASFSWQLSIGANAAYSENLSFDLGYRYFNGGKVKAPTYITISAASLSISTPYLVNNDLSANELFFNVVYRV